MTQQTAEDERAAIIAEQEKQGVKMDSDQLWQLRGVHSQVRAMELGVIDILIGQKITKNKKRDLLRQITFIAEQIECFEAGE